MSTIAPGPDKRRKYPDDQKPNSCDEEEFEDGELRDEDFRQVRRPGGFVPRDAMALRVAAHKIGRALSPAFKVTGAGVHALCGSAALEGGLRVVVSVSREGWTAKLVLGGPCWPWESEVRRAHGSTWKRALDALVEVNARASAL